MCHGGCGILATVEDGKIVKVEGDPDMPLNLGTLCPKGLATIQYMYHPNRLKYPLKRVGERGEGKWQRISWDEAYDTITKRVQEVQKKYGPLSVGLGHGTGRLFFFWPVRLLHVLGSPNWFEPGLIQCLFPRITAAWLTYGLNYYLNDYSAYGGIHPRCIVMWGVHPPYSNDNGKISTLLSEALEKGKPQVIVVDPRYTSMSKRADVWLPVRPGTDAALAMAMLNVIINEKLYDEDFLKRHTNCPYLVDTSDGRMLTEKDAKEGGSDEKFLVWDAKNNKLETANYPEVNPALFGKYKVKEFECKPAFQLLADRMASMTPEKAAEITWVPVDRIYAAARMYANSKPATIQWGNVLDYGRNTIQTCRAINLLSPLCGNVDVPGGDIFGTHMPPIITAYDFPPGYDLVSEEAIKKRIGYDKYSLGCTQHPNTVQPSAHIPTLMKAILTGKPYPIRAMFSFGGNHIVNTGDTTKYCYEAYKSLDFLVAVDFFMTPTCELADIVLPAAMPLECDRIISWPAFGPAVINFQNQVVPPPWETKEDENICLELAKRFGVEEKFKAIQMNGKTGNWDNLTEFQKWTCKEAGIDWETARFAGPIIGKKEYREYNRIKSPTGKVEIYSNILLEQGHDPLPFFIEPAESPVSTPDLAKEYPLVLTTGARSPGYMHSEGRQIPWLRELWTTPTIELNPKTAVKYGIEDGDWVWIETPRGKIRQKAKLTEGISPGVVNADHHWWFPEKPTPDHGAFDSNTNVITDVDHCDPIIGSSTLRGLLCKVYRADGPPEGIIASSEDLEKYLPNWLPKGE